jgi:antitoxin HigA-1
MKTIEFTEEPVGLPMTYGERLQKALDKAGRDRKELAHAAGCTVQAIGIVITGGGKAERMLSAPNHVRAARFLRVDSYWLATGEGAMEVKLDAQGKELASLSADAMEIAVYFDKLTDKTDRTIAYVQAMAAILKALAEREVKNAAPATEAPAAVASPGKSRA